MCLDSLPEHPQAVEVPLASSGGADQAVVGEATPLPWRDNEGGAGGEGVVGSDARQAGRAAAWEDVGRDGVCVVCVADLGGGREGAGVAVGGGYGVAGGAFENVDCAHCGDGEGGLVELEKDTWC